MEEQNANEQGKLKKTYLGYSSLRQVWRVIYPVLIFLAANIGVVFIISIAVGVVAVLRGALAEEIPEQINTLINEHAMTIQLVLEIILLAIFLPIWLKTRKRYRRYEEGRVEPATMFSVIGVAFGAYSIVVIAVGLVAPYFPSYESIEQALTSGSLPMQLLAVGILAPIAEELCFRGVILSRMENLKKWLAILISAALFGLVHLNPLQSLYAGLTGILMGVIYIRFRSIWYAIAAHMTFNLTGVLLSTLTKDREELEWMAGLIILAGIVLFFVCGALLLKRPLPANPMPISEMPKDNEPPLAPPPPKPSIYDDSRFQSPWK